MTDRELYLKSIQYRIKLLKYIKMAGAGHTGGSLSCVDILNVLYNRILNVTPETFKYPGRDRYVQSKGHSVEALYAVLADRGFFPEEELETFYGYGSDYTGHPTRKVKGIEHNTGGLGHGLAFSVGAALAGQLDHAAYRVFTLLGDGELAEGSNWESLMAAAHYHLDNLCVIVDRNSLQLTGKTEDMCGIEPLAQKLEAFGGDKIMSFTPGTELGKANLEVFAETLLTLAQENKNVLAVTSDSRGSGKLMPYAAAVPDQLIEVGIAEQNLVGVAAGLASAGKIVYAVSPASFLTARALEQIKNDVCYSDQPVKLIGISAGVSYGALGSTHHAIHDIAVLRAINNITIIAPADNLETTEAIKAAAHMSHPVYIRFGKRPMPHLHPPGTPFEIGKALQIRNGRDIAFIATGETVHPALKAIEEMEQSGYSCRLISMHTIKPLDIEAVIRAAEECRAIVTVEEHRTAGGLGEACAAMLIEANMQVPFKITGIPDEYTVTGNQLEIFAHYGLTTEGLSRTAMTLLEGDTIG